MAKDPIHELGKRVADMADRDVDLEEFAELFDETPEKNLREYQERLYKQEKDLEKEAALVELKQDANKFLQKIVHSYFDWKAYLKRSK